MADGADSPAPTEPKGNLAQLLVDFDNRLKALEARAESALEPRLKKIEDWLGKL